MSCDDHIQVVNGVKKKQKQKRKQASKPYRVGDFGVCSVGDQILHEFHTPVLGGVV